MSRKTGVHEGSPDKAQSTAGDLNPCRLDLRQGLFGAARLTLCEGRRRCALAFLRLLRRLGRTRVLTESPTDKAKSPARLGFLLYWRRVRDSNPGNCCQFNGFRIRPVRPLRQLSKSARMVACFRLFCGSCSRVQGSSTPRRLATSS